MKTKLATTCLVIGSLLAPVAALAADPDTDRTNASAFVKDSIITTKVKAKLAAEKFSTLAKIQVDTDHQGEVLLTGNVNTEDEADKAISIARRTEGVTAITSKLKVVPKEQQ